MKLDHDGGYLIAASMAGAAKNPAWFLNLQHNPEVTVEVGGAKIPMNATVIPDEDRDAMYQRFIDFDKRFAGYQEKTSRKIPVVSLQPT